MNNRQQELRKELLRRELTNRQVSTQSEPSNDDQQETFLGSMPKNAVSLNNFSNEINEAPGRIRKAVPGMAQGYANSLIGMANLLPKVNIPKVDLAPHTKDTQKGELVGDVLSYFGPRMALSATKVPHLLSNALKNHPISSAIVKNMGAAAEAALFGASHAPEGQKGEEALKTGLAGSGIQAANALLSSKFPLLARLGALGLGGYVGNQLGHPLYGAMIGSMIPELKNAMIGPSRLALAENALADINPSEVAKSIKANKALGTVPTPGQAAGSYTVQAQEGALRGRGGKFGEELEKKALDQQSQAAKSMLDKVYKPSKESEKAITDAYKKAYKQNLPEEEIEAIKADPIMKEAFDSLKRNPKFKDIPENNYEFLSQVNREIYKDYVPLAKSSQGADRVQARKLKEAREYFDKYLKEQNPDYKEATKLAAPKYARQELEDVKLNLHEEQLSGKNVYKRLLETPKKYKEAQRILKPYPKALEDLKNMRDGWKEYANIKTGSQAEAQGKSRLDQARNIINTLNDMLQSSIGKKATQARLNYMHSPEWQKDFELIKNAKNAREQVNRTMDAIGRLGLAYGLSDKEVSNLKDMIASED